MLKKQSRKVKSVGSISDFLNQSEDERSLLDKAVVHYKNNRLIYNVAGTTIILILTGADLAFAETRIDKKANEIYDKIINVGKWIIVIKGAIDVIKNILKEGDIDGAKKSFFGHLIAFLLLLAYPWAMNEVENLFT